MADTSLSADRSSRAISDNRGVSDVGSMCKVIPGVGTDNITLKPAAHVCNNGAAALSVNVIPEDGSVAVDRYLPVGGDCGFRVSVVTDASDAGDLVAIW
jgi:hypothetical protein